ncbi:uncharacterized protein LOC108915434 [Anoplophora glabripennis]|uniref:uncharacterized protein LOC108915434 n=1 Tax=Anoplophora glabripennis TaxID=217634 RepID=UPI000875456E|nr:uncharacterized protein LOC108915434 [Anoplophora glabripennis]
MRWLPASGCLLLILVGMFQLCITLPVGNLESALEVMAQIPQWHCMRYRKFELVRRCRSYKNSLRRS